jgi:hypothetical protein
MEPANTNTQSTPPKKHLLRKFTLITTLVLVIGLWIFYLICGMTYSEGTRSGILTKVSKKGIFFKTFEGELNIGGINQGDGTIMPNTVFKFSVYDDKTYHKLDSMQGRKVVVTYKQVIKNFFWQGESDYFIHDVRSMN